MTNGCDAAHPPPDKCDQTGTPVGQWYNLKGFLVGNGATNWNVDAGAEAYIDTLWGFNMVPNALHKSWKDNKCQDYFGEVLPANMPPACVDIQERYQTLAAGTDIYDLYRKSNDVAATEQMTYGETIIDGEKRTYKRGATVRDFTPWMAQILGENHPALDKVILGDFVADWFNDNTTRADLNIPTTVQTWEMCTSKAAVDAGTYVLQPEGSFWIYPILAANGYRILHYSGDTDGAVPTIGTKRWVELLQSPVKAGGEWRNWLDAEYQVGGFVVNHEVLDFATVRGVGHMAPQWKP